MQPAIAARLADIREWAADPSAVIYPIRTHTHNFALFPHDVIGTTDEQLLEFIRQRCNEPQER